MGHTIISRIKRLNINHTRKGASIRLLTTLGYHALLQHLTNLLLREYTAPALTVSCKTTVSDRINTNTPTCAICIRVITMGQSVHTLVTHGVKIRNHGSATVVTLTIIIGRCSLGGHAIKTVGIIIRADSENMTQ